MINQADVLKIMASRDTAGDLIPFSLTLITCNLTEGTGGQRRCYEGVTLAGAPYGKKDTRKDANHYENYTRNVMIPGKSRPTTIHVDLITHFNGERVMI